MGKKYPASRNTNGRGTTVSRGWAGGKVSWGYDQVRSAGVRRGVRSAGVGMGLRSAGVGMG